MPYIHAWWLAPGTVDWSMVQTNKTLRVLLPALLDLIRQHSLTVTVMGQCRAGGDGVAFDTWAEGGMEEHRPWEATGCWPRHCPTSCWGTVLGTWGFQLPTWALPISSDKMPVRITVQMGVLKFSWCSGLISFPQQPTRWDLLSPNYRKGSKFRKVHQFV